MKRLLVVMMAVMAITGLMVGPGFGAEKLIVNDASSNPKFVVTDTGQVSIGANSPLNALHINTTTPSLIIDENTSTFKTYLSSGTTGSFLGSNLDPFTGNLDDIAKPGWALGINVAGDTLLYRHYTPGANPRPGTNVFAVTGAGRVGFGGVSNPAYPIQVGTNGTNGNGAYLSTGGVWTNGSSREFKENIQSLSAEKAIETVKNLDPVTYAYKVDPTEKHVGFIAEDVPALVATQDRKHLSPMDIVAVLTKVVQEQQKQIEELSTKISQLERENSLAGKVAMGSVNLP